MTAVPCLRKTPDDSHGLIEQAARVVTKVQHQAGGLTVSGLSDRGLQLRGRAGAELRHANVSDARPWKSD